MRPFENCGRAPLADARGSACGSFDSAPNGTPTVREGSKSVFTQTLTGRAGLPKKPRQSWRGGAPFSRRHFICNSSARDARIRMTAAPCCRMGAPSPGVFPRGHVTEIFVVAQSFSVGRLMLFPKMPAARFVAIQRVDAHQLGQFKEIRHAAGLFERLIDLFRSRRALSRRANILRAVRGFCRWRVRGRPALRDIPQSSQTSLPSSRWNESTVRDAVRVQKSPGTLGDCRPERPEIRDARRRPFRAYVLAR